MGIEDSNATVHLFYCVDEDLRDDMLQAHTGNNFTQTSEKDIRDKIKTMAVKVEINTQNISYFLFRDEKYLRNFPLANNTSSEGECTSLPFFFNVTLVTWDEYMLV